MNDRFSIDSHKVLYHPERVASWLAGETIPPIYVEISPSGACNHRCRFCALDFMEYRPRFLDADILAERLAGMGTMGIKSVMYAGEGEPFLHRDMAKIAVATKKAGIDVAFTTNAVLLKEETLERILPVTEWIKVSCNAGCPETYAALHRTRSADFDRVFANMEAAITLRRQTAHHCTLGMQLLLLPENAAEVESLARRCRDTGLDYLVVKPYSQHPQSQTKEFSSVGYSDAARLAASLESLNNADFQVVVRLETMERWDCGVKVAEKCLALPFWSYIDAGGDVWACSMYLNDMRFHYGNINEHNFDLIWSGEKRRSSLDWCAAHLDPRQCRINCRMDRVNSYLWQLVTPPPHVNFI